MSALETSRPDGEAAASPGGNAGKARPKGAPNKVTLAAREVILLAAEGLGGVDGLIAWARKSDENERIFWSVIYPKVLPHGGGPAASPAAAVTGALVWRRPDHADEAAAAAAAELATPSRPEGSAIAAADGHGAASDAATADPAAAAADAAPHEAAALMAVPRSLGATVVWKPPEPGLPGLPGGPAIETGADGGPASPRPPPDDSR
jgi:hypothetical protein